MKGMRAENRVAASLRRTGASVEKSPGSRTSADMTAKWRSGKEWLVQVKYSGRGVPSSLKSHEKKSFSCKGKEK